jgi:hypothetical protein
MSLPYKKLAKFMTLQVASSAVGLVMRTVGVGPLVSLFPSLLRNYGTAYGFDSGKRNYRVVEMFVTESATQ